MLEKVKLFFAMLFENKFKFVFLLFSTLIFLFVLFPLDDLGDLVTEQVYKLTGKQVFVQFDRLQFGVLEPGLTLKNFSIETPHLAPIDAQEIRFLPSISGLIFKKPAGSLVADGIFKGRIEASLKPGVRSDNGLERQKIEITAQKISLAELRDLSGLPMTFKGRLDLNSNATVDLTFQEQPDMDLSMRIEKFELPTESVNTMMGPLSLPELKLSSLELKGRLSAGKFHIEDGKIGGPSDELQGSIKGDVSMTLKNTPQGLFPVIGAYDFKIDLKVQKNLQDRAALFLSFLDQYKTPVGETSRYQFQISASNPLQPPAIGPLR